jgi:hypothetical protein
LNQQTAHDTFGCIYKEEAIVTRRKVISILNELLNVLLFLIQKCAYFYERSLTAVFEAKYRIIPEINLRFNLKQEKFLYWCMLAVQNEKQQNS